MGYLQSLSSRWGGVYIRSYSWKFKLQIYTRVFLSLCFFFRWILVVIFSFSTIFLMTMFKHPRLPEKKTSPQVNGEAASCISKCFRLPPGPGRGRCFQRPSQRGHWIRDLLKHPLFEGHDSPLKGSQKTIPKRSQRIVRKESNRFYLNVYTLHHLKNLDSATFLQITCKILWWPCRQAFVGLKVASSPSTTGM